MVVLGDSPVIRSARDELVRGVSAMLARTMTSDNAADGASIVIGTRDRVDIGNAGRVNPGFDASGRLLAGTHGIATG